MSEKHIKSKETDITGALVIALVLMIGALIVKVAGDFTSIKTTSTKAEAKDYKTDTDICAEKVGPLSNGTYPKIKQAIVGSGKGKCQDGGSGNVSAWWGTGVVSTFVECLAGKCAHPWHNLDCCINSNDYDKIGTAFCNSFPVIYDSKGNAISPKPDARCQEACNVNNGYSNVLYYNSSNDPSSKLNLSVAAWCKTTTSKAGVPTKIQGKCCFK